MTKGQGITACETARCVGWDEAVAPGWERCREHSPPANPRGRWHRPRKMWSPFGRKAGRAWG